CHHTLHTFLRLFLLLFFFSCSLHHAALHSFPTRRSSDLHQLRPVGTGPRAHAGDGTDSARLTIPASVRTKAGSAFGISIRSSCRDRKSTRLNSSHRTISYAVFCLKKKINRLLLEKKKKQQ